MSDGPDFSESTSPGFGRKREGQTVELYSWPPFAPTIAAGALQVNSGVAVVPPITYLFQIDSAHLWTDAVGPQRYIIELLIGGAWVVYFRGWFETSKMFRVHHVMGASVANVENWRETIYNDNDVARSFISIVAIIKNELN
jgi:hypothetical protein